MSFFLYFVLFIPLCTVFLSLFCFIYLFYCIFWNLILDTPYYIMLCVLYVYVYNMYIYIYTLKATSKWVSKPLSSETRGGNECPVWSSGNLRQQNIAC